MCSWLHKRVRRDETLFRALLQRDFRFAAAAATAALPGSREYFTEYRVHVFRLTRPPTTTPKAIMLGHSGVGKTSFVQRCAMALVAAQCVLALAARMGVAPGDVFCPCPGRAGSLDCFCDAQNGVRA